MSGLAVAARRRLAAALAVLGLPGRVLAVAVVVCWLASARLGWLELRVAALAGLGALTAAALLTLGRSAYAVTLELQSQRVVVGERAVGRVAVRNTATRRLLPARLELPVGRGLAAFELPSLAAGAEHEDLFTIPTSRRAVVVVGPVRSVRGDPFSLLRRELVWTARPSCSCTRRRCRCRVPRPASSATSRAR